MDDMERRCIILIDADAFFASVEQKDHPEYRGKPVIVGHDPKGRGVVSTCSYEARAFGVRSAMPISTAWKLCPHGIFIRPRMERYKEVSQAMFAIMEKYTPTIEVVSIDEAYLDVSGEDGVRIASAIRKEVKDSLGLTVTAGVSYCKYLAKIAAESAKPDGLRYIPPEGAMEFLDGLDVSRIPGIGPKTSQKLKDMGIRLVKDLRQMPHEWFSATFGKAGTRLLDLCRGIDREEVKPTREAKSVSEEETFQEDIEELDVLLARLALTSQNVAVRRRRAGLRARVLGIKVRFSDFSVVTRERTLPEPASSDWQVHSAVKALLTSLVLKKPVRLLGVFARSLESENPENPPLFSPSPTAWDQVSRSIDSLRLKYGKPVLFLGASLEKGSGKLHG